jgi:hypothetical protein
MIRVMIFLTSIISRRGDLERGRKGEREKCKDVDGVVVPTT